MPVTQRPLDGRGITIGQVLDRTARKYPHNTAIVHSELDVTYTYRLLLSEANRVAKGLIQIGTKKGDRVGLRALNVPEWIISQMALAKIGAVLVPIDPGLKTEDLHYILEQAGCGFLIMAGGPQHDEYINTLCKIPYRSLLEKVIVIDEEPCPGMTTWNELREIGDEVDGETLVKRESEVVPTDPVAIMYTSGTTGKPKGVVLDHVGLVTKSAFSAKRQGLSNQDRLCLFFPLFHMFGNTCICLTGLLTGASVIMPSQTFEPSRILSAIDNERCTAIYGSPSMFMALIDHPEFKPRRWETVHKGTIGGAPCPMALMRRLVQGIGISDITVAYGITEASSWITMTRPHDPLDLRVSTIGTALECNEVKILDPITGEDFPPYRQGELCTRDFLMKEYYHLPGATASAIDKQGWFHTGDLGEMDEKGYVKITGRIKDVIVRDGIEIYPTEVEETIYKLPGVLEVQVFGFPHPERGQEVAAWIKLKKGANLSLSAITKFTKEHMNEQSAPQYYKFVTGFPMTRSGKVQKFRLAEMATKEYLNND
jgi:fatty-acyl-CoA synthase